MAYTKTVWIGGEVALSDTNMNHIEKGIEDAHVSIDGLSESVDELDSDVYRKDEVIPKSEQFTNTFGTPITIPRTLTPNSFGNNDKATFNYTFPSDGYLLIDIQTGLGSYPMSDDTEYSLSLNGVRFARPLIYNDSTGGSGTTPIDRLIKNEFVFVKKGMVLTGTIYIRNLPNALSNIKTIFIPFEPYE